MIRLLVFLFGALIAFYAWFLVIGAVLMVLQWTWPLLVAGFVWLVVNAVIKGKRHDAHTDLDDPTCSLCTKERNEALEKARAQANTAADIDEYQRLRNAGS